MAEFTLDFTNSEPIQTAFPLSPQQKAVMEWVRNGTGNGMITAVAGAGKTSTLIEALSHMRGTVAFAAYNKRIADEIAEKVAARGLQGLVTVKTFHAFGFQSWRRSYRSVRIDGNKLSELINRDLPNMPKQIRQFATKLVSIVRQSGVGYAFDMHDDAEWNRIIFHYSLDDVLLDRKPWEDPIEDDDELADLIDLGKLWARRLLERSIAVAPEVIDFDDQIFMPAYRNLPMQQYDWVLVDEAQDTNAARLELATRMLKPGGRILAVGDPMQAIYGFSGADSASLTNIANRFNCHQMGLTVSYRCPQNVVRHAQQWASHIEPAADAPEGWVGEMRADEMVADFAAMDRKVLSNIAILCRNNKPLVDLAFALLRERIPCHVEGRDIGGQIKGLATRWKTKSLDVVEANVIAWRRKEVEKYLEAKKEAKADSVADRCDTLLTFIAGVREINPNATVDDLVRTIEDLFEDDSDRGITLSSIHKSKGREWETIYWLGRNAYQPSKFATQDWQLEQERNLMYVAATRAKVELIEVIVE